MGNKFICMTKKDTRNGGIGSRSKRGSMSRRRGSMEEELLHKQALAMAIQQHQLSQRFDNGSMSRRIGSTSSRRRAANLSDPLSGTNAKQLPEFLENIKTKKFVLVHGEGLGAWCWYKTIAHLEEMGLLPVALDLAGSGIDLTDTKNVTTMEEYSKPLIDFLQKLPDDEKVILVGHSSGGACVSYALEQLPQKISKAIYLGGTMISDGQRPFDVFAEEKNESINLYPIASKSMKGVVTSTAPMFWPNYRNTLCGLSTTTAAASLVDIKLNRVCRGSYCSATQTPFSFPSVQLAVGGAIVISQSTGSVFVIKPKFRGIKLGSAELFSPESKSVIYGNGKDNPPTGFMFEKQHLHGLYFNQSPAKDVALAMVSMRPIPLGPMMEKLSLTKEKYGTGRRFYIQTLDDHALSPDVQEKLVRENPPEGVFKIKGSDHCPFFSKPQSLHKLLLEIAQIP